MTDIQNIRNSIENSKHITLVSAIISIIAAISACFIVVSSSSNEDWQNISSFTLCAIPFAVSFIFAISSMFYAVLQTKSAEEQEEQTLLERRKSSQSAFDIKDDIRFSAKRSLERYIKYGGYIISIFTALIISFALLKIKSIWSEHETTFVASQESLTVVSAILLFVAIFAGAFCLGQSRDAGARWLRPVGAWLIVASIINLFTVIASICTSYEYFETVNAVLSNIAFWAIAVLAIELLAGIVMEFYRPRTNELERPLFESRILSLFTESGGIMRNIENTLDYQFGFKISQTSLYSFFERSLLSFILFWLFTLWLFTSIVQVKPGEHGLRERFGRVIRGEIVDAGIHMKLPWPFERIKKVSVSKIHEVIVGGKGNKRPETVLWSEKHYDTTVQFLVGTKAKGSEKEEEDNESLVSFLSVRIPVQYQVKGDEDSIYNFLYAHADAVKALQNISEVVVTKYFASVDVVDIMSKGRGKAVIELKSLLQNKVDELKLGVDIVSVNLHDVHPPVGDVAVAFQDVIGAQEEKQTSELDAQIYERTILPKTEADAQTLINSSKAYKSSVLTIAKAEGERFVKQTDVYNTAPEMYKLKSYLTILESLGPDVRKYIVSDKLKSEVYEIDLKEKSRMDLLDVDLGEL